MGGGAPLPMAWFRLLIQVGSVASFGTGNLPRLWTDTRPPNSASILAERDSSGGKMLDSVSKVERYRKEANRCAELAKEASPPFLAEIYRKVAIRYVFMAEELLRVRPESLSRIA
jgi:hypothetical protein